MIRRDMLRPNPVPVGLVLANGVNNRSAISVEMPCPDLLADRRSCHRAGSVALADPVALSAGVDRDGGFAHLHQSTPVPSGAVAWSSRELKRCAVNIVTMRRGRASA